MNDKKRTCCLANAKFKSVAQNRASKNHDEDDLIPHSLRRVNTVAAMRNTIEIATQKC